MVWRYKRFAPYFLLYYSYLFMCSLSWTGADFFIFWLNVYPSGLTSSEHIINFTKFCNTEINLKNWFKIANPIVSIVLTFLETFLFGMWLSNWTSSVCSFLRVPSLVYFLHWSLMKLSICPVQWPRPVRTFPKKFPLTQFTNLLAPN